MNSFVTSFQLISYLITRAAFAILFSFNSESGRTFLNLCQVFFVKRCKKVIIDKESYKKEKAGEILEEWFDGSAKELISAISGNIKKDDTEELKGILDGFDFK